MIQLNSTLMAWMGVIMAILTVAIILLLPLLRPLFLKIQIAMGTMNNRVWQAISGITTIKEYTAEKTEIGRFEDLNKEYIDIQMGVVKLQGFLRPLFFFIFALTELVILWVGGKHVIQGRMSMGELLQFTVMVGSLTFPILALGWMMSLMQQGISALSRIRYILEHPVEDLTNKIPVPSTDPVVEIKNLNYQYPGHKETVLKDIELTVEIGKTIGITGPVGSGKTTLINIITGLLKPEPGQVFVNGHDICDIRDTDFFRHVAVVSQDPFLFSKTVAENISLGPNQLSREDVVQAAENAGLKKDIEMFHDGYEQAIGERGITLSGGQKQRVAIARALSKCTSLLVMDDPLSNVDSRTEEFILDNLKDHKCYRTLIIVSHRISVLKSADIIYVLDNGTIVERGNHGGLMRQGGLYSRLGRMQQMEMELEEAV
jgi:ATP-binding cassette subfamily B protein